MSTQWHYRQGKQEIGPVSAPEIKALAKAGVITPETLVKKNELDWVKAGTFNGLFVAAPEAKEKKPFYTGPLVLLAVCGIPLLILCAAVFSRGFGGPTSIPPASAAIPKQAPPVKQLAPTPTKSREAARPVANRPAKSSSGHKESLTERAYEKLTGKEVVHRKDGTTYERKQPKKK